MENIIECKAVIFDLDGTLVDSSVCIEKIWRMWCDQNNVDFDKLIAVSHGRPTIETMREFLPNATKEMADWFLAQEMNETEGLVQIEGAGEFISKLPENKWAIATSGVIELASARVKSAGLPIPKVFITADKIKKGKPDPESFLLAAEQLGVKPEECMVFEDSAPGIKGAIAAGTKVIAVNTKLDSDNSYHIKTLINDFTEMNVIIDYCNDLIRFQVTK